MTNANSPINRTINNSENSVNNCMIYSIGVVMHRWHIIISFHVVFNKYGRHAISAQLPEMDQTWTNFDFVTGLLPEMIAKLWDVAFGHK